MAVFNYKALGAGGAVITGELTAGDRGKLCASWIRKGCSLSRLRRPKSWPRLPSRIKLLVDVLPNPKPNLPVSSSRLPRRPKDKDEKDLPDGPLKMKSKEVVYFTEELSDMLAAGLQLEPALRAMEDREEEGNIKEISQRIRNLVRDGTSFSNALKRVSPSFGPLYCSLAAAGEASGALDTILRRQAHYLKTIQELRGRITLALIYPAFLILSGIGVSIIFVTKLIPQLTGLLKGTPGSDMPIGSARYDWGERLLAPMVAGGTVDRAGDCHLLQSLERRRAQQASVGSYQAQDSTLRKRDSRALLRPVSWKRWPTSLPMACLFFVHWN